jgi:hypothetical protein
LVIFPVPIQQREKERERKKEKGVKCEQLSNNMGKHYT